MSQELPDQSWNEAQSSPFAMMAAERLPMTIDAPASIEYPPLRSSCDSCNLAKVKCSKHRPGCRRCASRGIDCVYGVSLRGMKRPRQDLQGEEAHHPDSKERMTDVLSLSQAVCENTQPLTSADATGLAWPYGAIISGSSIPEAVDLLPLPISESDLNSPSSHYTIPYVEPYTTLLPVTLPPTPTSPSSSFNSPRGSQCSTTLYCCHGSVVARISELATLRQVRAPTFHEFLTEHRASMEVCRSVLECVRPQHGPSVMLLLELLALLIHMIFAFDQVLHQEHIIHANLLRSELAKLGMLIEELHRRFCVPGDVSWTEDMILFSPVFANLQWKTQIRVDAVRMWMLGGSILSL